MARGELVIRARVNLQSAYSGPRMALSTVDFLIRVNVRTSVYRDAYGMNISTQVRRVQWSRS